MKILFACTLMFSTFITQLKSQTVTNNILDYVSVTPSANQFDRYTQTGTGSSINIIGNKLNLTRAGSVGGVSVTRLTSMGLPPTAKPLQLSFDFDCAKPTGVLSGFGTNFSIGALTDSDGGNASSPVDAVCTFRIRFNTDSVVAGKFRIENFRAGNTISGFTQYHTGTVNVVAIINPTTSSFSYDEPNSTTGTLAPGRVDIYMDGVKEISAGVLINSVVPTGFKINLGGVNSNVNFDNIVIQDAIPASFLPLPVDLLSFTGKSESNSIVLNWATASEQNSSYFEVSKYDATSKTYTSLAKVNAVGNSSEKINYQYIDKQPDAGANYYQLKQVDRDGISKTYPDITVNNAFSAFKFQVSKSQDNTYQYKIFSNKQESVELSIIGLDGKLLSQKTLQLVLGYNTGLLATSLLNSGLYLVRLKDANNQVFVKKLMVSGN